MATFNKFNVFVEDLAKGVHNLNSNPLKVMLTNVAPSASNTVKADITEIASGNGYTAGGNTANFTSGAQSPPGTYKLILADPPTWTATGGSIGPFRYAVLYNSTPVAGNLIGWWDYGSSVTLANTEQFTVDLDNVNGVLTIA